MKDIKCTIKSAIRHQGAYYRGEQAVNIMAALVVPYEFGEFSGDLLIADGHYAWTSEHFVLTLDFGDEGEAYPLFGTYILHGDAAYSLSRGYHQTAHDALNHALPRLGSPMLGFIARIDALDLHPACAEAVPA